VLRFDEITHNVRSTTATEQHNRELKQMDFRKRYVAESKRKTTGDPKLWVNFGKRSEKSVQEMLKYLGTQSNSEVAQILKGLCIDLAQGKLVIQKPSK
jgi:hypothetical protein